MDPDPRKLYGSEWIRIRIRSTAPNMSSVRDTDPLGSFPPFADPIRPCGKWIRIRPITAENFD
jgi:hypothetical protein